MFGPRLFSRKRTVLRTMHRVTTVLMLASLLAGLIPPPLVGSVAPAVADLLPQPTVALAAGTISGTVFRDFNSNGAKDSATAGDPRIDTGVAGVTVTVYDAAGAAQGNAVTSSTGAYSISASGTGPYRVEFTTLPTGYYPTTHNSNSGANTTAPNSTATTAGTTVQFVPNAGASNVNLGINAPEDYSQANPRVVIPIHAPGSITPTNTLTPALYSFTYGAPQTGNGMGIPNQLQSGTGVENPTADANLGEIGATWGLGYDRQNKRLFAAAVLQRQVGLGPLGLGGIYVVDYSSGSGSYVGSFNLQGVTPANGGSALDLGSVTRVSVTGSGTNATANGLNTDPTQPSKDIDAFAKVGKVGFGDIEVDNTQGLLWAVNLNQHALISINVRNYTPSTNGAVPGTVNQYLLSGLSGVPTCTNGVFRPWALKLYHGAGYLGGVCSAETAAASGTYGSTNIAFYVLQFDPANPTAGFTTLATAANYNHAEDGSLYYKWCDDVQANASQTACNYQQNGAAFRNVPQPIFTNIEFREDGSLIGGIADRYPMQQMTRNYDARNGAGTLLSTKSNGDLIFWCKVGGNYVQEGSAGCAVSDPTTAPNAALTANPPTWLTTDGLSGAGEFFYDDWFVGNPSAALGQAKHNETPLGALALLPGAQQVLSAVFDPVSLVDTDPGGGFGTQGVRWFNTQTGALAAAYQIKDYPYSNFNTPPTFAKGDGLGDLELLSNPAPIEIGNRVWLDSNGNGSQDPNEPPLSGVIVELYKNGVKIGEATTDANGEYYFVSGASATDANTNDNVINDSGLGIIPATGVSGGNSLYALRIPNVTGGSKQAALGTNVLTSANAGSNDSIDSDGSVPSGQSYASYVIPYADLASAGYNNHTYDFGFAPSGAIQVTKQVATTDGSSPTVSGNFTINVNCGGVNVAPSSSQSVAAGGAATFQMAAGAVCTVSEDTTNLPTAPSGYTWVNAQVSSPSVTVVAGQTTAVTAKNTLAPQPTATNVLTVTKTISGTGTGSFNISVTGPSGYISTTTINGGETKLFTGLANGVYTVTESTPAGWTTVYTATTSAGSGSTSSPTNAVVTLQTSNTATLATTAISGKVFRDFNSDGQITANGVTTDTGVSGVTITVYDKNGNAVGSATSATDGAYTINPTGAGPYRVAFSDLPSGYEPTTHGPSAGSGTNGTSTQFVTTAGEASNVNLGINQPCDYCQNNPSLATTVYVNGDPANPTAPLQSLVTFGYSASGSSVAPTTVATKADIGSTWGVAYNKQAKILYSAALLKRHTGLREGIASNPLGAIYATDLNTGATTLFVDLSTLGVNVGSVPSNAARGLGAPNSPSNDAAVFDLIGKVGLGDIDLSQDMKTLYVMSLNDRKLYAVDVANKVLTGGYALPTGQCTTGTFRPFAVAVKQADVFAGGVCDGDPSAGTNVPDAFVYKLNQSSGTFSLMASLDLSYTKGLAYINCPAESNWHAWTSTFPALCIGGGAAIGLVVWPQPVLSDIQFDLNGDLILGFFDRLGYQGGDVNYGLSGTSLYQVVVGGDVLRMCLQSGAYVPEGSNASCPSNSANGEGPNGGEFYFQDNFFYPTDNNYPHREISEGGLALLPGSGHAVLTAMDPLDIVSGGALWLNNATGTIDQRYQVWRGSTNRLSGSIPGTQTDGFFGKANGLGDLELLCDPALIEIGNRVWNDLNGNGIQDPGEPGFSGLTVSLQGPTNTVTTNTDANGLYYFNVNRSTAYTLTITPPSGYSVTTVNAAALSGASATSNAAISDTIDSDAVVVNGKATIYYTTGSAGQNNHGLDFGFIQPVSGKADILNIVPVLVPSILLKKYTNGYDADTVTGPYIQTGDVVTWTYVVTNTGNVTLTDISITDDKLFGLACLSVDLAPGASTSCTATDVATAGQYTNTATVTGVPTMGPATPVTSTNPSHYFGADPALVLKKYTNGYDADTLSDTRPQLVLGEPVTWTYVITNTGNVTLSFAANSLQDDQESTLTHAAFTLLPGASKTLTQVGTVKTLGIYTNTATVTGVPSVPGPGTPDLPDFPPVTVATPVTGTNPGHYEGLGLSLGNRLWVDNGAGTAANRNNGRYNTGEPAAPQGTVVELLNITGTVLLTTTTDSNGYYRFDNLAVGSYQVRIPARAFVVGGKLYGYASSTSQTPTFAAGDNNADHGDDVELDGVTSQVITLNPTNPTGDADSVATGAGSHGPSGDVHDNLSVDFGFVPLATFGNFVWIESDSDGIASTGVITPVGGLVMTATDSTGTVYTTTTAANGYYTFSVPAAVYTVTYGSVPSSYGGVVPSATPNNGAADKNNLGTDQQSRPNSTVVTLAPGDNLPTIDFGFHTPRADLSLTKTVDKTVTMQGDTATYTLVLTNHGPDAATNIQVRDLLPVGVTWVSDSGAGAYAHTTGLWTVNSLAVNASVTLMITVTVK